MKEYKSISIKPHGILQLGEILNEYAEKGWYIKDDITKRFNVQPSEFIYLLERDVKKWKAAFGSIGFEDRFIEYLAATKEEVQEFIEKETRIEEDEKFKYFQEVT